MCNELMTFSKVDYRIDMFFSGTEQWIQLKTVLESLGQDASHASRVAERLPEDYKKLVNMTGLTDSPLSGESDGLLQQNGLRRGPASQWFVNRSGVYRAVLTSNSPKAEPFLRWLETEVIPSIEKNGYYIDKTAVAKSPEKMDRLVTDVAEIRANEKIFFAKVKQYFTMATDYDPENKRMQAFFAVIQNRFLFAVTGHTAIEIVIDKIDHEKERCGMVQDVPVTKANLAISKNYLDQIDLQQLINLCNLYLHCLESIKIRDRKVTTEYLMSFFDQLLRDLQYQVMNGQDHPSCKQRDRIVQREYNLYKQIAIEDRQPQLQESQR